MIIGRKKVKRVKDHMIPETYDQKQPHLQTYQEWEDSLFKDPGFREIYQEEASKKELWLQLVEARRSAGITQAELAHRIGVSQAQVARIEKCGYKDYNLNTLRRYVEAVGKRLEVAVV